MNILKMFYYRLVIGAIIFLSPRLASAQIDNPLKYNDLSSFLTALLDVVIKFSIPIVILAVVYAGFLFVTAGENVQKIDTAKKVIFWTLVGAVIILGARIIAGVVSGTVEELGSGI